MPLIMMTGFPSSGKTRWAQHIKATFEDKIKTSTDPRVSKLNIVLINDESLGIDKSDYAQANWEKAARGLLFSAVERYLGKECLVICDGLNYIKGFRYQLSCSAKALGTPHCLVHVGCPPDQCAEFNRRRGEAHTNHERSETAVASEAVAGAQDAANSPCQTDSDTNTRTDESNGVVREGQYTQQVMEELIMRYEEPNVMTRWDSPCFTIIYTDTVAPLEAIWDALVNRKIARPNAATLMKPAVTEDYLYQLDKATQSVVTCVMDAQAAGTPGATVPVDGRPLVLPDTLIGVAALQRLRRQFNSINRNLMADGPRVKELFVDFLNEQWS